MIFDKGNSLQNSTLNIFHVKAKKLIFFSPWPFILFLFIDIKKREKIINEKLKY